MEEIFNIALPIQFVNAEKGQGTQIHITKNGDPFLKSIGDFVVREDEIFFFTGEKFTKDTWRVLGGKIAAFLKKSELTAASLDCGEADDPGALLEGLFLGAYEFLKYKEKKEKKNCVLTLKADPSLYVEKETLCGAVIMVREWGHETGAVINPETLSERARMLADRYGLKIRVIESEELTAMGAGAITAVGQGSKTPSRMIILEYSGTERGAKPVALVGKAITFDAGGYSIKSTENMLRMKYDKCGALAVLGILRAAAELKLKTPLVGVICAAENMLSDRSYRPDDILTSLSGKTIEIKSTDAEGRLVLADGLTFTQKEYEPRCIIDYATLTGACVVALGYVRAGIMCPDEELYNGLFASGEEVFERIWRMPHDEEYAELLETPEADLKNSGGRWGGSVSAGMFLKSFVADDMPWAHLDIAGMADLEKGLPYSVPGATGFGIRLTIDWLKKNES